MSPSDRRQRALLVALALCAVGFGAYVRFADQNQVFCQSPDEMSEVMPGIRLHGLPLTNLGAPPRYNFLTSLFYSQHGLGDTSFYYLASGALSALRIPVAESSLYAAGGVVNLAFALAGGLLAGALAGAMAGWTFALFVLVSPFYVFVSKSGWARLTWTPLLLVLVFLAQRRAMRRRGLLWPAIFCALAGFVALTDGFVMLPIVAALGWFSVDGRTRERLVALAHDRVFLAGCTAIAAGLAIDLALGLVARARGSELTVMAYVLARGQAGALVPSLHVLSAWTRCIDYYFPFRGAWILVCAAAALAAREGLRGRAIGVAAAWFLLASSGILRYAGAAEAMNPGSVPGALNAYQIAPPSFLLTAWLLASYAPLRGRLGTAAVLVLAGAMAWQSTVVAFAEPPRNVAPNRLVKQADMPLSACRTVKAAAYYVRAHQEPGGPLPYVFHLSNDVYLGHIGELYYGLSYGGGPGDPNHLLDFGWHQFGRQSPPEAFYEPYGVKRFDYYVAFTEERETTKAPQAFAPAVIDRLKADGARVVCTIVDGGRVLGWILSYRDEPPTTLDYRTASAAWNRRFGRAAALMQQPLAGSAYHFGYQWRPPSQ
ncbi:MAG: hypothetical protein IT176_14260 [Acidobacteria bacterium]|nr:hypothetical protein [Acidobacteriota bacterium]